MLLQEFESSATSASVIVSVAKTLAVFVKQGCLCSKFVQQPGVHQLAGLLHAVGCQLNCNFVPDHS